MLHCTHVCDDYVDDADAIAIDIDRYAICETPPAWRSPGAAIALSKGNVEVAGCRGGGELSIMLSECT